MLSIFWSFSCKLYHQWVKVFSNLWVLSNDDISVNKVGLRLYSLKFHFTCIYLGVFFHSYQPHLVLSAHPLHTINSPFCFWMIFFYFSLSCRRFSHGKILAIKSNGFHNAVCTYLSWCVTCVQAFVCTITFSCRP